MKRNKIYSDEMNVVFLLGNGFDRQLGLSTGYEDFYKYYLKKPSTDTLIAHLKEHINDYIEGKGNNLPDVNWKDLEMALGKYTQELKSYEELKTVYLDINKELMAFLRIQEAQFNRDEKILGKLRVDFSQPERYLSINEKRRYHNLLDGDTVLSILSLNYTRCCEMIYEKNLPTANASGNRTTFGMVAHIHGDLEMQNVLMGVNDTSQIVNEMLREDIRVKRMLVKPVTNELLDNQKEKHLLKVFDKANVIVVYGASLGDSDLLWREKLKEKLTTEKCYFLINEYQDRFDNIYDQADAEDRAKVNFITKLGLGDEVEKYQNFVFVAVTMSMFKPEELDSAKK